MFKFANRVQETTTTTGTGTLNLAGASAQFQSFVNGIGNGNKCSYSLLSGNGTDWEVGIGTVTSGSPNTLSRDTILDSSNSGSAISITGTSTVFCTRTSAVGLFGESKSAIPTISKTGLSTSVNLGTSSHADNAAGYLWSAQTGSASDQLRGYTASYTAPLTTVDLLLSFMGVGSTNGSVAVGFTDGTKFVTTRIYSNNGMPEVSVDRWTNSTTFGSEVLTGGGRAGPSTFIVQPFWLRIKDDNTNISWSISHDGQEWTQLYSEARGAFLGGANAWFFGSDVFDTTMTAFKATIHSFVKS